MHFSQLISALKFGTAGLESHQLAGDPEIVAGASIEKAEPNQISFIEIGNALTAELMDSRVGAVLLPPKEDLRAIANQKGIAWAVLKNPRLAFAESLELLNPSRPQTTGIHPTAVIGEQVVIEEEVSIGAHVCIGNESHIGRNSVIHPGVVIYEGVIIGEANELHANSVIHQGSRLGEHCIVHSNAVVGSEGFGFVPTTHGWRKMPQTGIVVIEDDVEVGCGSTIDRPSVGETRIGKGTKIDNLVQIGHGVTTGKGCAFAAQVGIAGGAKIGDGVILAGQVGVANRVAISDRVIASSKSGIHKDVAAGEVVSGYPAISNRLWLRCSATFNKLPEMAKTLRELKRKVSL